MVLTATMVNVLHPSDLLPADIIRGYNISAHVRLSIVNIDPDYDITPVSGESQNFVINLTLVTTSQVIPYHVDFAAGDLQQGLQRGQNLTLIGEVSSLLNLSKMICSHFRHSLVFCSVVTE